MTAAATAVAGSIVAATAKVAAYGDEIDKNSQKLGISSDAYQEWDFILQHSGSSISALTPAIKKLSAEAIGGSDAFDRLGISQEQVASLSQEDLFSATITALQGVTDESTRTDLATQLLGKSAMELAPLMNTSAEETENMRNQVHDLGGVMGEDSVKAAAAYQDALQNAQVAVKGLSTQIISDLMPSVTTIMEGFTLLVTGDEGGLAMVNEGIRDFIQKIIDSAPKIIEAGTSLISTFIDLIVDNLPQIISLGFDLVLKLAVGLIQAIPELVQSIPELVTAIVDGFASAFSSFMNIGVDIVKGIWQGILSMGSWLLEKVKGFLSDLVDSAKGFLGINSPSKVFAEMGGFMAEGLGVGWEDDFPDVKKTITKSLDFGNSSIGFSDSMQAKTSASMLNGMMGNNSGSYNISVPISLDGKTIAQVVFDPLQEVSKQKGVAYA